MPIISYKSVLGASEMGQLALILVFVPVPRFVILSLIIPKVDKDHQLKFPTSGDFRAFLIAENTLSPSNIDK